MLNPQHPEVLAADWVPPVPVGRRRELERLVEWLGDPLPPDPRPWGAAILGPPGSGTSTLARLAARRLYEASRREGWTRPPLGVAVRVRWSRGTHAVASELLQRLDEGFRGQGFPTAEIVAGFLRRLRRESRPAIVVLDDLGPGMADVRPLLRAFAHPDRFLPEGESGTPTIWTILAGTPEAGGSWESAAREGFPIAHRIALPPYTEAELRAILEDRWRRAAGNPPRESDVTRLMARSIAGGGGASRAMDLLRRELLGAGSGLPQRPFASRGTPAPLAVEPRVLEALASAAVSGVADLSEIRHWEERLAREQGVRPMPATTLWRRMVRLEAAGYLRREVRPGGAGGTRSRVALLEPAPGNRVSWGRSDTPREFGHPDEGSPPPPAGVWWRPRSAIEPGPAAPAPTARPPTTPGSAEAVGGPPRRAWGT